MAIPCHGSAPSVQSAHMSDSYDVPPAGAMAGRVCGGAGERDGCGAGVCRGSGSGAALSAWLVGALLCLGGASVAAALAFLLAVVPGRGSPSAGRTCLLYT